MLKKKKVFLLGGFSIASAFSIYLFFSKKPEINFTAEEIEKIEELKKKISITPSEMKKVDLYNTYETKKLLNNHIDWFKGNLFKWTNKTQFNDNFSKLEETSKNLLEMSQSKLNHDADTKSKCKELIKKLNEIIEHHKTWKDTKGTQWDQIKGYVKSIELSDYLSKLESWMKQK